MKTLTKKRIKHAIEVYKKDLELYAANFDVYDIHVENKGVLVSYRDWYWDEELNDWDWTSVETYPCSSLREFVEWMDEIGERICREYDECFPRERQCA